MRAFAHKSDARQRPTSGPAALPVRRQTTLDPDVRRKSVDPTPNAGPGTASGVAAFGHDFSRIPAYSTEVSRSDRTKSSEGSPLLDEEVTQPDAGIGISAPFPADAGPGGVPGGAGVRSKKAKLKSGPTYTPSGTVKATRSGGTKTATFKQKAEFEHDSARGIDAAAGEVRQYIKWTAAEDPPKTGAFTPASAFPGDTWYEDRDPAGKRYGHRTGPYAECVSINHYEDSAGTKDCANGAIYVGEDTPVAAAARTGKWSFELRAVDTTTGREIGTAASVAIDWNV